MSKCWKRVGAYCCQRDRNLQLLKPKEDEEVGEAWVLRKGRALVGFRAGLANRKTRRPQFFFASASASINFANFYTWQQLSQLLWTGHRPFQCRCNNALIKILIDVKSGCWNFLFLTRPDIDVKNWCSQWQYTVCWGIFAAGDEFVLMMKDLCRQKESITQPVEKAWGGRSRHSSTRHHQPSYCNQNLSSPKGFQCNGNWSPSESFWLVTSFFSMLAILCMWVGQWSNRAVSINRCWHQIYPLAHLQSEPS